MALSVAQKELVRIGTALFRAKAEVDSLNQEMAWNFYPERADFTADRSFGEEFSDHLFSSYPLLARRELGNMIAAALRPRSQDWFSIHVMDEGLDEGTQERAFLEHMTKIQRRAMYANGTGFVRMAKQCDHDFVTFGNGCNKVGVNNDLDNLLYKNFHLRDCAWQENVAGVVDVMHRNWKPEAWHLDAMFPDTVHSEVKKLVNKDPAKRVNCRHIVVPARMYKGEAVTRRFPYYSLYVDIDHDHVLEEVGLRSFPYNVPRWGTVANSPWGHSLATVIALPDGRTTQAVVRTLREAGEKYVDPPLIAVSDAIRGDIGSMAGGLTTVDIDYDEKLGEALRPIKQNASGMPIGFEIASALRDDISAAFFLDKIQLPEAGIDMTATEIRRRLEEHIRAASPIYEPIEEEYNQKICMMSFEELRQHGAFPMQDMPQSLMDQEIRFNFRSPLSDMADAQDAEVFKDVITTILAPAGEIDPAQWENADLTVATRDAMKSAGWKAKWFQDEDAVTDRRQALQQEQEQQAEMAQIADAAAIAEQGGRSMLEIERAMGGAGTAG